MLDVLRHRGISDARVLAAMAAVPRELFVAPATLPLAYADTALPLSHGQTISQPYVVALMAEVMQIDPSDVVLEIGTGSGYAAAVLSMLAARVYTIERIPELADAARDRLATLGYHNVEVACGDGTLGWPARAPFRSIACAASGPAAPRSLLEQLDIGGRLVMPVAIGSGQTLVRITRVGLAAYSTTQLGPVQFVPLVGEEGWSE
jgi:protein-L-isoaspartate(D-aspartate) O-methyltransferase